ncbi:MAG: hypothetical protein ABEL76_01630 [Bradymonadaceae bacterium]
MPDDFTSGGRGSQWLAGLAVVAVVGGCRSDPGSDTGAGPTIPPVDSSTADSSTVDTRADVEGDGGDASDRVALDRLRDWFDVRCGARPVGKGEVGSIYEFAFDVTEGDHSFAVVPFTRRGRLRPLSLTNPSGRTLDVTGEYRHQNYRLFRGGDWKSPPTDVGRVGLTPFDWPIVVPYAPQFRDAFEAGTWQLRIEANRGAPCLYVASKSTTDRPEIDLNLYGVGVPTFSPSEVPDGEPVASALATARRILSDAGIEFGRVEGRRVPERIADRYQIVRERRDVSRLAAWGRMPDRREAALSVDVFLVLDLMIGPGGRAAGNTPSLPGAPGLHGNLRNGVVLRASDLRARPELVGYTLAHELAHFLGLRHTTEIVRTSQAARRLERTIGSTDPIRDTPECGDVLERGPENCPDRQNLMFPIAPSSPGGAAVRLTAGQSDALRSHPLVR